MQFYYFMDEMDYNQELNLPSGVKHLHSFDKDFYLLGTAHISQQSIADVSQTILELQPDTVCLELCWSRYHSMLQQQESKPELSWKEILFSKRIFFNLAQTLLLLFYKTMGNKFKIEPGAEMHEAIDCSERIGAYVIPADRDVEETLSRAWQSLSLANKFSLAIKGFWYICGGYNLTREKIEEMKQPDKLATIIDDFADDYPALKKCMIDERDCYLAENIIDAPGQVIVAIIGAGHLPGVEKLIQEHIDLEDAVDFKTVIL